MVGLGILAVLVVLGIPVAVVALIVGQARLRDRVAHLERALDRLSAAPARAAETPLEGPAAGPWAQEAAAAPPLDGRADAEPDPVLPDSREQILADSGTDAQAAPPPVSATPAAPAAVSRERASALADWLMQNWVYVVSAVSLAFAGVFFVQYGIENGLLSPTARVLTAIGFGVALIGGGEWVRRRYGDDAASSTAYLPSVFSGAGIVSIFAGLVAARQLYGLIGVEAAFAGLVATAFAAILLGWFHGPLLAAIGLIGGTAAPFVVGGSSDNSDWLFGYLLLIAAAGLAIDAMRRWAWVSVLAVTLAFGGAALVFVAGGGSAMLAPMLGALVVLAVAVPAFRLVPDHDAPSVTESIVRHRAEAPIFPVRLAAGTTLVASAALALMPVSGPGAGMAVLVVLALLLLALAIWGADAPGLADLTALPAVAFLARIVLEAWDYGPLFADFAARAIDLRPPETSAPGTVGLIMVLATAGSLAAAWRSFSGRDWPAVWAAGAALFAPVTALALELLWHPAAVIGAYGWALHVIALAALMAVLAERFARADGEDRRRAAYAALSCLSLVALALFLVTTKGALTLALGALVVTAAALDRRFRLPEMGWFIQAGVLVLGWRLIADPGLGWALEGPLWEVILAFGGAIIGLGAALWLIRPLDRRGAAVFLESGLAAYAAIFVNVMLTRFVTDRIGDEFVGSYWSISLNAMPWIVLMLVQLHRFQLGGWMRWVRGGIAALGALFGLGGLAVAAFPANPVVAMFGQDASARVHGPMPVDTLLLAYGLPAILLVAAAARMRHLPRIVRAGLTLIGVASGALYLALEIRRFWQGDLLSVPGVTQAELYSYTVALLIAGALLLYQAIARRSAGLRRIAMAVIALTVAKVFLLDASGLTGLTRVFSFLALGLSLAALAWLNRWAAMRAGDGDSAPLPPAGPPL